MRLSFATIYICVSKNLIPVLSRGKHLLFSKNQITLWIKANRPKTNDIDEIKRIIGLKNESEKIKVEDYYSAIKGSGKNDYFLKIIIMVHPENE